jgi:hypothetical protein
MRSVLGIAAFFRVDGALCSLHLGTLGLLRATSRARIWTSTSFPETTKHSHNGSSCASLLNLDELEVLFIDEQTKRPWDPGEVWNMLVDTLLTHNGNVMFFREWLKEEGFMEMRILATSRQYQENSD